MGQAVDRALRQAGLATVVIDLNVDTVAELAAQGRLALFGDASQAEILKQAGIARASHLVVTLPHSINRTPMVAAARQLGPGCRILVRARYLREREELRQVGADAACFEEVEAAVALTARVLADLGKDADTIARETDRVRRDDPARADGDPRPLAEGEGGSARSAQAQAGAWVTGFTSRPMPSISIRTSSPDFEREARFGHDAGAGQQEAAVGKDLVAEEPARELLGRALQLGECRFAAKRDRAASRRSRRGWRSRGAVDPRRPGCPGRARSRPS